jgi:signal transduction histidine kinase
VAACPHGLALKRGGAIVFANPGYARLLGSNSPGELIGKSAAALLQQARRPAGQNGNGSSPRPELHTQEFKFRHRGQAATLEILLDVTERRRLEAQLRESQKMEALGRAVGGLAHDFNNLLTAVMLYCDLLRQGLPAAAAPRRHAEEINLAAQRGAALVRQLLAFARQQVLAPKVLSLNAVVLGMRSMLQRLIGEDIELVTRCAESLGNVKVDPAQMQQVILNLVVNARDAMPAGGKLALETAEVNVDAATARHFHGLRPGRCVRLRVEDTGCGMSPEALAHAFEPFFTTKQKSKGTGLGLAMVYGIVTQSGGGISLESVAGKGTRVTILLPCVGRGVRARRTPPVRRAAARGAETVLLVEDDPAVADSAAQLLQENGYTVLKARDGFEAVRFACEYSGALDLLLCDVVLPGMEGPEVASRLRAQRPDVRVLYMSGFGERGRRAAQTAGGSVLLKPFTEATLTRKVRQVLDRPRAPATAAGKRH